MTTLAEIETPALLLDDTVMQRNIDRMRLHLQRLGVPLRPHVKTVKSIEIVRRVLVGQPGGITVSTLKEAELFFSHGIRDILYAVGITPAKLAHVGRLIGQGADLSILVDGVAGARAIAEYARSSNVSIPVLIELDVDGHRSGIAPSAALLIEVARELTKGERVNLRGVMTHAGGSYDCRSEDTLRAMAERERAGATLAAERLRQSGFAAPVVSVGSTPTATFARSLAGITEVRAGVYVLQDLVMAGLGVCTLDDIAASVLVSVIGHQPERAWVITDGGWMALSRDRGTSNQPVDQGYGVIRDAAGRALADDLIVVATNQEHGIIARRDGGPIDPARYPFGTQLRVLPNHACATAAQHSAYHVLAGEGPEVLHVWPRFSGW